MKRAFLFLALLLMGVLTFAQETITVSTNSEDISQSLDLKVIAKLFAEANTTEQFEIALNNPDSAYSNLDLNDDGNIDYLRVVETGSGDSRLIVIQSVLAKDIYQDIASIYVEKNEKEQVSVQIIGDEYIYGTNYIIEPVYIYRPVIYNWLWSSRWYNWYSPWYWGYYPRWWYYRPCYSYHWYYNRCYNFHHYHHNCSFHYGHYPYHGYHSMNNSVSHREYASQHPHNSFNNRNQNITNANSFRQQTTRTPDKSSSIYNKTYNSTYTASPRNSQYTQKPYISSKQSSVQTNSSTNRTANTQYSTRTSTQQYNKPMVSSQSVYRSNNTNSVSPRSTTTSTYRTPTSYSGSNTSGSIFRSGGTSTRVSGGFSSSIRK